MSARSVTVLVLSACLLVVLAALVTSCSRAVGSAGVNEEFDQFGDRTHQMSAEARLLTRKGEPEFESAKAEIANGQYKSGIGHLERLVADRSIDAEIREEALLSVAEAHGSWLNPFKDYEKGMQFCQQFLNEYPDSAKRDHAESLIAQYREALAKTR